MNRSEAADIRLIHDDEGLTLVELIIYIVVGGIVLGLLGSVFLNGMRVDGATRDRDVATGTAQVISNSITMSVRNASEVQVDGPVLRARVAVGVADWQCRAWYFDGTALRFKAYTPGGAVPAASGSWKALGEGVLSASSPGPFTLNGKSVAFALTVTVEDAEVPVAGSAVARALQEGTPARCW